MSKRDQIQQEALDTAIKHQRAGLGISMGLFVKVLHLKYIIL